SAMDGPISIIRPGGSPIVSTISSTYSAGTVSRLSQSWGDAPQSLRPGTTITVYGAGFLPGSKVSFGDQDAADRTTPASISPSGTSLTVQVPRYAVSGKVHVYLPTGTELGATPQDFTVYYYRNTDAFSFHNFSGKLS